MSHGDFYVKGNKLKEVKPFPHGLSPQHTKYIWENKKKGNKGQK